MFLKCRKTSICQVQKGAYKITTAPQYFLLFLSHIFLAKLSNQILLLNFNWIICLFIVELSYEFLFLVHVCSSSSLKSSWGVVTDFFF